MATQPLEAPVPGRKKQWRKWNNSLHRDLGYLIVGLTVVYGISGIALNHIAHWNPNYQVEKRGLDIGTLQGSVRDELVKTARDRLRLTESPRSIFRPDPDTLQLFYPRLTYTIDVPTGKVLIESVRPRRVLFEFNQLHLNAPKKLWTWIADLYALSLILVAITGLFVLKGKKGIRGRGAWLSALGAAIPLIYWLLYLSVS